LIALFGSAYSDVEENATDEYLAFFAHKTIDLSESLLREGETTLTSSPSTWLLCLVRGLTSNAKGSGLTNSPAPFNLIEAFLIAPFE
jgi:hypothetical protein